MVKIRKFLAFVLAFAMTVSLFTNYGMPVFAEGETDAQAITLDFVAEGEIPEAGTPVNTKATINATPVKLYKAPEYGAEGTSIEVVPGTEIELVTAYTFADGQIIYRFDYSGDNTDLSDAALSEYSGYPFISANDVTTVEDDAEAEATPTPEPSAEPTATPEPSAEPTATPEATAAPEPTTSPDAEEDMQGIKDYGSLDFDAYIIPDSLVIYGNHIDDVEQKTLENVAGEKVHVWFFYELEDGTIKYKVEYTGENTAISEAITEGYEFVKFTDVAKIVTDSESGVSVSGDLPQDVTVTVTLADAAELPLENADITIGENSLFYDVTLLQNGETFTADSGVTVTFPAANVPFAFGTTYYAYHIKDDGTVETYGPFEYTGGDIAVELDSLSYVGIAETVETTILLDFVVDGETPEGINLDYPTATIIKESVDVYEYYTYNSKGVQVDNVQGEEIEILLSFTYSNNEVIYQYAYRNETNADLKDAAVTYYFISADDVELVGEGPTEEEITEAYNRLMKSATFKEYQNIAAELAATGVLESFTEEQLVELGNVSTILQKIEEQTIDWDEYEVKGGFNCDRPKLYLNPITMPDEYVTVNMDSMIASLAVDEVMAEEFTVEGKYTHEETGITYYILDTSAWSAFEGVTPYQFAVASDIVFTEKWTELDGKAIFTVNSVGVYDNTYSTYNLISDGLAREAFDILYSFEKDNYDGTVTPWYLADTTGWIDSYGNEISGIYVKQADVKFVTNEEITELYNSLLNAATAEEYSAIYAKAQAEGMHRFLDEDQQAAVSGNQEILEKMAANTQDVSAYNIPAEFVNAETKLYLNPVTQPDEYVTAVVEEKETSLLTKLFSAFSLVLTAKAAGEEITAENVDITGVYTDENGNEYYTLDTSAWSAFSDSTPYTYVAASDVTVDSGFETLDNQAATLTGTTVTLYRDMAIYEPEVSLGLITWEDSLTTGYGQMDTATTAVINHSPIVLYEDYRGASGKYFEVEENTEITLTHYYEYSNGVIIYGASYTGDNAELAAALDFENGTHPFVYAGDITLTESGTTPSFTIIPDMVTLNTADIPSTSITLDMKYTDENGEVWYGISGGTSTWSTDLAAKAEEGIYYIWIHEDDILPQDSIDAEQVYTQLMGTETIEEWDAIVDGYTDEELQSVGDSLTDEQNQELSEHLGNLPTAKEKAVTDAYNGLLAATTVAEYEDLYAAVSDEIKAEFTYQMEEALIDHVDELIDAEDTTPKNVTTYTKTAPFLAPVTVSAMQPISLFSARNAMRLANTLAEADAGTDTSTPVDNAAVITDKKVVLNQDGTYKVTLESYVTGAKVTTSVSEVTPTDIIIVVDQSGSMENNMSKNRTYDPVSGMVEQLYNNNSYRNYLYVNVGTEDEPVYKKVTVRRVQTSTIDTYTEISPSTNNETLYDDYEGNLYYKVDGEYVAVTVERDESEGSWFLDRKYKYTYTDENGKVIHTSDNDAADDTVSGIQFYSKTSTPVYSYTFTYENADGTQVTQTYSATDFVPTGNETTAIVGNTFYFYNNTTQEPRLDALRRAITNFTNAVTEKTAGKDNILGTSDDVNHRIAIVGFSSDNDDYDNTEILTGCTITQGSERNNTDNRYFPTGYEMNGVQFNPGGADYIAATKTAYVDMSTTAGQTSVTNAINALTAEGGTYTDNGTQMALDILENDTYVPDEDEERNRVVIIFTDGTPGLYSSEGFQTEIANDAIEDTKVMKADIPAEGETGTGYGATVYTIGIFDNANGQVLTNTDKTNAYLPDNLSSENKFMHFMSSNFKAASSMSTNYDTNNGTSYDTETFYKDKTGKYTGDSYYLSASDSESLNNIFETISGSVTSGGSSSTLDETTVVKDIVAPNFQVPTDATNIKTYTATATGKTGDEYTFATRVEDTSIKVEIDGTDVNVKGFDFSENWVGTETVDSNVSCRGKKLIIEFDIPVDPDFIGGNKVKTNGDDSGIYTPKLDENGEPVLDENNNPVFELVENFERPTVDIALKNITATWQNQYIYVTNNADILELFTGAAINNKPAANVINGENNAYVDIEFTITGPNNTTVGTYTIDAGETFENGDWDRTEALYPALTEDTDYTISWAITPINEGTYTEVSGSATAHVYVFNPVLTFKDSVGFLGGNVPEINDVNNLVSDSTVWENASQGYAVTGSTTIVKDEDGIETATGNTLSGTEPDLTITYEVGTGGTDGIITTKSDIPVNVTSVTRADNTGVSVPAEYEHQNCSGETCTLPEGAELVIHVYSPTLTLKDSSVYYGGDVPTVYNKNVVSVTWENTSLNKTKEGPALSVTGTTNLAGNIVNTTTDIPVTVTVTCSDNNLDITSGTTINHQDCKDSEDEGAADLLLHVYVPSYTFADAYAHLGATVPTDQAVLANTTMSNGWVAAIENGAVTDNFANSAPTLTLTYAPKETGVIADTDDIGVEVAVSAGGTDITGVTKFAHTACAGVTETLGGAEFLLHVQVPTLTFKDLGVHYGASVPGDEKLKDALETGVWPPGTYMTTAPELVLDYEPAQTGVIKSTDDIPVNVTVQANGVTITEKVKFAHTDCTGVIEALGDAEFLLHVYTPVFTFKDSTEDYASRLANVGSVYYEACNKVLPVSWEAVKDGVLSEIVTEEPVFTFTYTPEKEWYDTNQTVTSPTDVYVNVVVNLGDTQVSDDYFEFEHETCDVAGCAFSPENGEFIVHINKKYTSLTITKNVVDETGMHDQDQTFIFDVTGTDYSGKAVSMKVVLKAGESVVIDNLLVDSNCTVVEDRKWSWRYTAHDEEQSVKLDADDKNNQMTFTNTLSNSKWLDSNCYEDNEFAGMSSSGTTAVE